MIKYIAILSLLGFLTACGKEIDRETNIPGPIGTQGNTGTTGATGPAGSQGTIGNTGIQGVAGTNGAVGSQILVGTGVPSNTLGTNGDFYLNITNNTYYKKVSGSWGSALGNLTGSTGPAGSNGTGTTQGLSCALHDLPTWNNSTSLPQAFIGNQILGVFTLAAFNIPDSQASLGFPGMPAALQTQVGLEGYALDCDGYLNIVTSGDYIFKLLSDDGSEMRINNVLVINNQGLHAPTSVTSAVTRLNRGLNRINVVYYQGPYTQVALELRMSGPNFPETVVPAVLYTH